MNVVLINQFFPPAQAPTGFLLGDLATELGRRGHAVTVLTSAAGYGAEAGVHADVDPGVRVIRVGPAGPHRNGIAAKLGDYLFFFRRALRELSRLPEEPEVLVCMTTPPFCGRIGVRLRKRRGIPYVLWCMDLYPEALVANGFFRPWNPVLGVLRSWARIERSQAAGVIALGPDMAARLSASGAMRVEEVPVWSGFSVTPAVQAEARELRRTRGWTDEEVILLYSGNMGRAHRVEEFAVLADRLRGSSPRARLVFSGGGPQRAAWEKRGGGLFEFMPPVSGDTCAAHLLAADVHLVSQQPEWMGVVVPSKFQAACASGRPVVFAGPPSSAVGTWIQQADAGWVLPPGDMGGIEAAARGVLDAQSRAGKGARASRLFEQRFTRAGNCGSLADHVEKAARGRT